MNVTQLKMLLGSAVALLLVYGVMVLQEGKSANTESRSLLGGISSARIAKLVLAQGTEQIELVSKDGQWALPSRNMYPADASKVNAFLLKLFDLTSSQRIPTGSDSLAKLGVADTSVQEGSGKIVLKDSADAELASLILGKRREDKGGENAKNRAPTATGQYLRRGGEQQAYLIGLPVTLTMGVSNWIDTTIANVREANVWSVTQSKLDGETKTSVFSLTRPAKTEGSVGELPDLKLQEPPAEGDEEQESILSQVRSGLENARLTDVQSAADAKDFKADRETVYQLLNGLVYTIATSEKDSKVYGTIRVKFDQALADTLKADQETRLKAYEAAKAKQDEEAKAAKEQTEPKKDAPVKSALVKPELVLSSDAEAQTLTKRYEPWVYEFVTYQGKKYRYARTDIVAKKAAPAPSGPNGNPNSPHGMPAGMPPGMGGMPQGMPLEGMPGGAMQGGGVAPHGMVVSPEGAAGEEAMPPDEGAPGGDVGQE